MAVFRLSASFNLAYEIKFYIIENFSFGKNKKHTYVFKKLVVTKFKLIFLPENN